MKYVVKLVFAIAAAVGTVYLLATKGEEIVAWAKRTLESFSSRKCCCMGGCEAEDTEEAPEEVCPECDVTGEDAATEAEEEAAEEPAQAPEEVTAAPEDFVQE